jgi:hypothetical protein
MARFAMRTVIAAATIATALGGCAGPEYAVAPCGPPQPIVEPVQPAPVVYGNPIFIPVADHQCAWEHVVATVSDYFRIGREEPVRVLGNTAVEGTIETIPEVSPTLLEPWRRDTGAPPQRLENTLQTMRRRAVVRVTPVQGGHSVDVQVFKELEDNQRPDNATAGSATFRYDSTMTRIVNPIGAPSASQGWIARGRDSSLEQNIIGDLLSRCTPNRPMR